MSTTCVWRHPRPRHVAGRCLGGRTDVPVDPRKARRLAHRIRRLARREGRAREVWTSPLARSADVGRWLARWGWVHHVDARVAELDFGDWDGRRWSDVPRAQVDAWCDDLAHHAPPGGESVAALMARCAAFLAAHPGALVVAHGGWIHAAARVDAGLPPPRRAAEWPPAVPYGAVWRARNSAGPVSQ